eukprot:2230159-Rhodomonas_salina.1
MDRPLHGVECRQTLIERCVILACQRQHNAHILGRRGAAQADRFQQNPTKCKPPKLRPNQQLYHQKEHSFQIMASNSAPNSSSVCDSWTDIQPADSANVCGDDPLSSLDAQHLPGVECELQELPDRLQACVPDRTESLSLVQISLEYKANNRLSDGARTDRVPEHPNPQAPRRAAPRAHEQPAHIKAPACPVSTWRRGWSQGGEVWDCRAGGPRMRIVGGGVPA